MAAYTVRTGDLRGALVAPQAVSPALAELVSRIPEVRQALAAAWAATRTPADWCKAAELRARYGSDVPIFTYPRGPVPPKSAMRPWISRLLRCE
ncbi:MAG: hypothetical protein JWR24_1725 [Actinoallomurus sp.]|uniref:hypothetical protein n=1 Tax=Actinacidiphila oryziradicis TaxID=2571141 RepID=UPI0023F138A5|nr:hypothetical protein [Actinacidiphila oryziradicis]MCW2869470.1 hypothetical protein [Actinacidiphila oryziradicis]MCW2945008.1 hypothetical protein [Actinoallomurus sp.]